MWGKCITRTVKITGGSLLECMSCSWSCEYLPTWRIARACWRRSLTAGISIRELQWICTLMCGKLLTRVMWSWSGSQSLEKRSRQFPYSRCKFGKLLTLHVPQVSCNALLRDAGNSVTWISGLLSSELNCGIGLGEMHFWVPRYKCTGCVWSREKEGKDAQFFDCIRKDCHGTLEGLEGNHYGWDFPSPMWTTVVLFDFAQSILFLGIWVKTIRSIYYSVYFYAKFSPILPVFALFVISLWKLHLLSALSQTNAQFNEWHRLAFTSRFAQLLWVNSNSTTVLFR